MTSDSGRWFSSGIRGEIETRDPREVILAFYPRSHVQPSAEGIAKKRRPISNALRVLLPLGESSRRNQQGKGYRSALGLHPMVRYSIAIILYDSRSSITLERLEQKRAGKASMKSRITRSGAR